MGLVLRFVVAGASLWLATWMVSGFDFDGEFWQFLVVAAIMGLVNAIAKPILKLFSLPLIILTFGLFLLIVNAAALQLTVWLAGPDIFDLGLTSEAFFWSTFWAAIVVSIATWLLSTLFDRD